MTPTAIDLFPQIDNLAALLSTFPPMFVRPWPLTHAFLSTLQRILVATNLFGRGMDIERVNIVFNYDMPEDTDTYLHRCVTGGDFIISGFLSLMNPSSQS